MSPYRTDPLLLDELYKEWLSELNVYDHQLENLEGILKQLYHDNFQPDQKKALDELEKEMEAERKWLKELNSEIQVKHEKILLKDKAAGNVITLTELIANNRLRDRVRKAEQTAFFLKYQVNKLLSIAS